MSKCNECDHNLFHKKVTLTVSKTTKSGVLYCPYCQVPKEDFKEPISWDLDEVKEEHVKDPNSTVELAGEIFGYISSGYSDYIAARQLLLSNQNLNGAIFACQALEKLIKALIVRNKDESHVNYSMIEPFMTTHRPYELYHLYIANVTSLKKYSAPFLNKNFLRLLEKTYPLRYKVNFFNWGNSSFQEDNKGFNVILNNRQILFELDRCVKKLMYTLTFKFEGPYNFKNPYLRDLENAEPALVKDNATYQLEIHNRSGSVDTLRRIRDIYFRTCHIQEIVVDSKQQLRELFYFTHEAPRTSNFDLQSNIELTTDPTKLDRVSPKFTPVEKFEDYLNIFFKMV